MGRIGHPFQVVESYFWSVVREADSTTLLFQTCRSRSVQGHLRAVEVVAADHLRHHVASGRKPATASRSSTGPAHSIDNHKPAIRTRECGHQSPHRHARGSAFDLGRTTGFIEHLPRD